MEIHGEESVYGCPSSSIRTYHDVSRMQSSQGRVLNTHTPIWSCGSCGDSSQGGTTVPDHLTTITTVKPIVTFLPTYPRSHFTQLKPPTEKKPSRPTAPLHTNSTYSKHQATFVSSSYPTLHPTRSDSSCARYTLARLSNMWLETR